MHVQVDIAKYGFFFFEIRFWFRFYEFYTIKCYYSIIIIISKSMKR